MAAKVQVEEMRSELAKIDEKFAEKHKQLTENVEAWMMKVTEEIQSKADIQQVVLKPSLSAKAKERSVTDHISNQRFGQQALVQVEKQFKVM